MKISRFVAVTALLGVVGATTANAADLGHGYPPGSAYDDRRYSDIYRHPAPPPPRYAEPYYAPPPAYRDEPRFAPPPPPPPYAQPYAQNVPPYRNDGRIVGDCLPRHVIREQLERRGWTDFHDPQVAGNVAHIRARRPNGRVFDLTVDRCSGQVLAMEPVVPRHAEAPADWRYQGDRFRRY